MNKKIIVFAIVLTAVVSLLFVNQAFAVQIRVFAPLNYAGQPQATPQHFVGGESLVWDRRVQR